MEVVYNSPDGRDKITRGLLPQQHSVPAHGGHPEQLSRRVRRRAQRRSPRGTLFKIGFQMKERFWEKEQIFGGISWTTQDVTQIWYPCHGIHRQKGVVLGAYVYGGAASERFETAHARGATGSGDPSRARRCIRVAIARTSRRA